MNQLGIDISKATFDASLLVESKHKNKKFTNDPAGFEALTQWLSKHSSEKLHVCMEGTGRLWEPLAEFLNAQGVLVSVVNPRQIKGFATSELRRSKTDQLDAEVIARFCRANNPRAWQAPVPHLKEIRDIQRATEGLKKMVTQEKNRLKAGVLHKVITGTIEGHIKYLNSEIARLEALAEQLLHQDAELVRKYELLTSIDGVGPTTAITFLSELSDVQNFASAKQLEVFCGIAPRLHQSGSSVRGRTRMSKVGNRRVRAALYMPSLSAMRFNPLLKTFSERLKSAGKHGRIVVCAVMRKLLRLMYAVLKSGRPFDRNYVSTPPGAAA